LNGVELRCSGKDGYGSWHLVDSKAGPDGTWSETGACPTDTAVVGFKARNMLYSPEQDNTGINDIGLACRSSDAVDQSILRFGDDATLKAEERRIANNEVVFTA